MVAADMARAWRIEYAGALYHVMSRGNEQQAVFRDDQDRLLFLQSLGEMSDRYEMDIFAYVLMGNHYHVILRTNRPNLSKAMQWLGLTYTRRFNLRHFRTGHLFQGRFRGILVENEAYVMRLSCYIHRNPLRARIVRRLADYPWSSYRAYAYGYKGPEWLKTSLILSQFRNRDVHRGYREKVQRYAKEEKRLWEDLRHGIILGTTKFVDQIRGTFLPETPHKEIPQQGKLRKDADLKDRIYKAAEILDLDLSLLQQAGRISKGSKADRDLLVFCIWKTGILSNENIGKLFGVGYSSISHIVKSAKSRLDHDDRFREKFITVYSLFKI